jgi:adenosylcobinamide-phosphate synthase (EC 6.3.1.10)
VASVPTAVGVLVVALALDAAFGEPPERGHPVALFGRVIDRFDREWRFPRVAGVVIGVSGPLAFAVVYAGTVALAGAVGPPALSVVVGGGLLFTTVSLRMLLAVAAETLTAIETDTDRASAQIAALVGRDTTSLTPAEFRSGVVESLAENLSDGFVAPLVAFALGTVVTLPVAVGAAAWIKGVNTLDSMLGYRTNPLGWASARLDDLVMYCPARVTAVLIAVAAGAPAALLAARAWARAPASPNAGWPMATLAGALGVQLRKPGRYALNAGAGLPTGEHARHGLRVVRVAGVLAVVGTGAAVWLAARLQWVGAWS